MRGLRRASIIMITLPFLFVVLFSTQAQAKAKRTAPFGLFGAVLDPLETDPGAVGNTTLDSQMGLMARSGVESLRVTFDWGQLEPLPNTYDWANSDRIVADAATHGLELLPDLIYTPTWASTRPKSAVAYRYQPTSPALFAHFATALVQRYGPHGEFWKLNPQLPRDPVTEWQIWNEEAFNVFWGSSPWPATYTKLLKAGYTAIHHVDRRALVVPGSLADVGPETQWAEMSSLYRAGAQRYFNAVSVHPFVVDPKSVSYTITLMLKIVGNVRAVMRRHGDAHKPVILTEMSWPGAVGIVPKDRLLGLETTPSGERRRLAAAYAYLSLHRRKTGITQAYWYTWASTFDRSDPQSDVSFDFSGLTRYSDGSFVGEPALTTYANTAARFEGCRKTANAKKCR
jgi:hypothetical protein